jgi:hypothetical protein
MERHCPRGQSPSRVVAPVKKKKKKRRVFGTLISSYIDVN